MKDSAQRKPAFRLKTCMVPALLVGTGLFTFGLPLILPLDYTTFDSEGNYSSIFILSPWVLQAVRWVAFCGFVLLLGLAVILGRRRRYAWCILISCIAVGGYAASWLLAVLSNLGPWTQKNTLVAGDGAEYAFLDSSFLQGQVMAITRPRGIQGLYQAFDVLGITNGDSPRSWASIIRPADRAEESYGQLYEAPSGLIVGIRYANHCYMAYDAIGKRFIGSGEIESLSPFVLLAPDSALHEADIRSTIERIQEREGTGPGCPPRETLEAGLTHPNLQVHPVAEELLQLTDQLSALKPP